MKGLSGLRAGNGYEPELPEEGELVCPEANKYVIFNGTLLHGVIPGRTGRARCIFSAFLTMRGLDVDHVRNM